MKRVRRISKKYYLRQIMACFLACYMLFGMPIQIAQAAPTGGTFTEGGTGTIIDGIQDSSVTVNQAVSFIDWDSFDTSSIESVTFLQGLMSNSAVLNRISGDTTQFDGLLSAVDMRIFLLNPAGIIFGEGSSVNANQLVASSMNMSKDAFFDAVTDADNDLVFTNPSSYSGDRIVANYGTINAADSVYLVGKNVLNAGTIITNPGGLVAMVAGDEMVLGQPGSPTIVKTLVVNHIENHTVDNGAIGGISSNLYDQFGLDASSNTGTVSTGELVLAAGDVWSNAVENVQDLTAVARGDIHFEEAVNITGDLKAQAGLTTQYDDTEWIYLGKYKHDPDDYFSKHHFEEQGVLVKLGGDVQAKDTITAGGSIDVLANGIQFDADVSAGPDADDNMTLTGRWGEDPIDGFHDIVTAGLTAGGNIDISVTGVTDQKVWEYDDWDEVLFTWYHPGQWVSNLTPTYEPGTIILNGDVAAIAGNFTISNSTDVTLAATLSAGTDLVLKNSSDPYENAETLTGTDSLTLVAGNEIQADNTTISVTGSELTLHQDPTLDTADFLFGLQDTTHLTLISDNGSVFSTDDADGGKDENAADQWASIGATANGGIILSGHENDIKARRLEAAHGPIDVDAKSNDILANDHGFTGDDGILASGGGNITLTAENVIVDGDIDAHYGLGIRPVGYNSDLTVEAADDIELDGYANVDGDMVLRANMTSGDGDMTATGTLTAGGSIDTYSSDTTTYLYDDVLAGVDITLHNNTWTEDGVVLDAGQDVTTDGGKSITGAGQLDILAGHNINLGGAVTTSGSLNLYANTDDLNGGNVQVQSSLESLGGDIYASGENVFVEGSTTAAGTVKVNADDTIRLVGPVLANGADGSGIGIKLIADHSDADTVGNIIANSTLTTTAGDIEGWGQNITVSGAIDSAGSLTLNAYKNITLNSSADSAEVMWLKADLDDDHVGNLWAKSYLDTASQGLGATGENITVDGKSDSGAWIVMTAGDNITLGNDATAGGSIVLTGDSDTDTDGDVWAKGKLTSTGGEIKIKASDSTIYLDDDVSAFQDVLLYNNTVVADGATIHAGDDVVLAGGKSITGSGSLTLEAGEDIILGVDDIDNHWVAPEVGTAGNVSADGDLTLDADGSVYAHGTLTTTSGGDIDIYSSDTTTYLWDNVTASGDIILHNNTVVKAAGKTLESTGDDVVLAADKTLDSDYDLTIRADEDIILGVTDADHHWSDPESGSGGNVTADGALTLDAGDDVYAHGTLTTTNGGNMLIEADDNIDLFDAATSNGSMTLSAGYSIETMALTTNNPANGDIDVHSVDFFTNIYGPVTSAGNLSVQSDNDDVELYDYIDVTGHATIFADGHIELATDTGAKSNIGEYLDAAANGAIEIYGEVETGGDLTLTGDDDGDDDGYVWVEKNLTAGGDIEISSSDWTTYLLGDYIHADGSVFLNNNTVLQGCGNQTIEAGNGTLDADGWVWKTSPGNLYLLGNVGDSEYTDAISLNNNRDSECPILACLPAASTSLGNLEIFAENGDIQISGDLTTFGTYYYPQPDEFNGDSEPYFDLCGWYDQLTGGVSVIAENGKIYTEGASPENDVLNIGIVGNSDQLADLGVDLPYQDDEPSYEIPDGFETVSIEIEMPETKKAAIVVMSNEDLKFGPDTMLIAKGNYDDSVVDDRAAVNFLDTPDTIIGDYTRDQGDAIDVAVYLASTEGDVHLDGRAIDVAEGGTMVVDAYDTVTFGDFDTFNFDNFDLSGDDFDSCVDFGCLMIKLMLRFGHDIMEDFTCDDLELAAIDYFGDIDAAHTFLYDLMKDPEVNKGTLGDFLNFFFGDGYFFNIDRLEVVSRVTEWLSQASSNGTLPYAGNAGAIAAFEDFIGGDYILRGAGLDNPEITDGRAWVLENPPIPEPLDVVQAPQISGCPAAMEAVANELAIAEETLQISIGGMLALNPTIQPCNACGGLLNAAAILKDEDGSRMAALNQVFNEVAPANVPFSPVMATSIVTAFADQVDDGSQSNYATAMEYIDAFVQYVAILDTQLGSPVEDSTAFVMAKYGAGITESENNNIAAFVAARLAGLESF